MSRTTLTPVRMVAGVWEGLLQGAETPPDLLVTHLGTPLAGVEIARAEGGHAVRVPVPAEILCDGVQTVLISDRQKGEWLAAFTLIAGSRRIRTSARRRRAGFLARPVHGQLPATPPTGSRRFRATHDAS